MPRPFRERCSSGDSSLGNRHRGGRIQPGFGSEIEFLPFDLGQEALPFKRCLSRGVLADVAPQKDRNRISGLFLGAHGPVPSFILRMLSHSTLLAMPLPRLVPAPVRAYRWRSMRAELLQMAADLAQREEPF